jgi:hypothetical protein
MKPNGGRGFYLRPAGSLILKNLTAQSTSDSLMAGKSISV